MPAAGPSDPQRIVKRLLALYPERSASRLKRAVLDGQVTVNGAVADDPGLVVDVGSEVLWDPNRKVRRRVDTGITVLHEDEDSIAVVKPTGLLTHPTEAKEKDTLQGRVSNYVARRERGRGYLAVVHRLDKETSGVLVFARSRRGLTNLQAQLRAHTMDRRYVAVVEGDLAGESGRFDQDLVEDRGDRRRGVARPGETGVRAITEWRVLERFGIATLVEARLKTGRTHQIRVHFAHAGHPVVADPVYRDPKRPVFPISFPRLALHAGTLGWVAPGGEKVQVETPLPADMQGLLKTLRKRKAPRARGATPAKDAVTLHGKAPNGGQRPRPPSARMK